MYLQRLKGRKSVALREMINDLMIVKLKNGKVYGGALDGYERGTIWLYYCKLLDKENHMWIDHDIMIRNRAGLLRDPMPQFWISEIKDIFILPKGCTDKIGLYDILQIYIDPHYRPIKGVECEWDPGGNHASECDARLHEALVFLRTLPRLAPKERTEAEERMLREAFDYVRRRLLMYGAKIP